MKRMNKLTNAILAASLVINPIFASVIVSNNVANANNKQSIQQNNFEVVVDISKIDTSKEISKARTLMDSNIISYEEYKIIEEFLTPRKSSIMFRSYYPEKKVAHISNSGVKQLYSYYSGSGAGLAKGLNDLAAGAITGSWGGALLTIISSLGGYSQLEQAVQQAYWQGRSIEVYYKIHRSITSLNIVRYSVV